ncbi:MAG TPA: ThuA domain-containing protein, partial [Isosphaeraceae bacterium]|nr:ThuA domain-containing protein [Isosphaeraceae bacterium]
MLRARMFVLCVGAGLVGLVSWAIGQGQAPAPRRAAPSGTKHVLVVDVTTGFRHSSIEVGEKVLRELAAKSGDITLDFASVDPRDPKYALTDAEKADMARKAEAARANRPANAPARPGGGFGPASILLTPIRTQADKDGDGKVSKQEFAALAGAWSDKLDPDKAGKLSRREFTARIGELLMPPGAANRQQAATVKGQHRVRRSAPPMNLGGFIGGGLFTALDADKDGTLTRDELRVAFSKWSTAWDADKDGILSETELRDGLNAALPRPNIPGFGRNPKAEEAIRRVLAEKMSPEALRRYDGVIFLNTTGDLPIPDLDAFYKWVEDGHAFIGMHAAADTLHGDPGYAKMLGGEFANHQAQVEVDIKNEDPRHPANQGLGNTLTVFEEVYLYKNYDPKNVHDLLDMDEHPNTGEPGHYPVSWTREYGKGRVFYTSLGHREDVWDPSWKDQNGHRENPPEVAEAYQRHLLGGIRWALGLPAQNGRAQARGRGNNAMIPTGGTALAPVVVAQGDKDGDGKVSRREFTGLAEAWFDKLDPDTEGTVGLDHFTPRFGAILPRSQQGFGPALFVGPGLFAASDVDKDGRLTRDELVGTFGRWFDRWDAAKAGTLDEAALHAGFDRAWPQTRFGRGAGARAAEKALDEEVAKGADFTPKEPIKPLSPAEEAKRFLLPKGYRLELVLAEPDVEEPVAVAFDGDGRMYVAEMRTYMQDIDGKNEHDPISRISRHEDTDGDGTYDRHTIFVDKLVLPRFVLPWQGDSVLAIETDADDVFKYTDTNGDGVADTKELFTVGVGRRGNLEHQQSGMVWGLDNWIYTTYNAFRLRWTPKGVVREPTAPNGGQWGLAQDDFGKMWFVDGGGERGPLNFQAPIVYGAFSVADQFEDGFEETWPATPGIGDAQGGTMRLRIKEQTLNHFTATCGQEIVRADRLPADLRGDLVFAEPVGRLVRRAKIVVKDGLTQLRNAYPRSEFIRSTDPLFRPVNLAN